MTLSNHPYVYSIQYSGSEESQQKIKLYQEQLKIQSNRVEIGMFPTASQALSKLHTFAARKKAQCSEKCRQLN